MDKILKVNMTDLTVKEEPVPERYARLGGRALIARYLLDAGAAEYPAFSPENVLLLTAGLLGGTRLTSSGRLSVGGKSPLTGGIKEANSGGTAGAALAKSGFRAIAVSGKPKDDRPYVLEIDQGKPALFPLPDLKGLQTTETVEYLKKCYGDKISVILIGPAGEAKLLGACVAITDLDGRPTRMSGRGGLGALMGDKGLKAVVIKGSGEVEYADAKAFTEKAREFVKKIMASPITATYTNWGTAAMVDTMNEMGGLPTRNFRHGRFEKAEAINAYSIKETIERIGGEGKMVHACMPGCVIRCSNVFPDEEGNYLVAPLEYETIGLVGSNCGIGDLFQIARINRRCNELGLDTIETGAAIGVAMEAGEIDFGDYEGAMRLLDEVERGTELGKAIGNGAVAVGKLLGVTRIPAVKNQSLPAYDPRAVKGLGVTFATSTMGADHTAGQTVRANVDHRSKEGQGKVSENAQLGAPIFDSLGLCLFTGPGLAGELEYLADLLTYRYSTQWTVTDLKRLARETLKAEHEFNRRSGFTSSQNRLPQFFSQEELPETGTVFDVSEAELDQVVKEISEGDDQSEDL
ncbi:MAG: aldehyde ferredoxin oxidoreductase [Firmicutes bacterium]|nr:aldehyde ferredoxin oxidoreductase [Bacillota bacterium]